MKNIVILTGSEPRHTFLRKAIALSGGCTVARTYCEGLEQSLDARLARSGGADADLQRAHVDARARSEADFFALFNRFAEDRSHPAFIEKGAINEASHTEDVIGLDPDLLVAYGCSLIKEPLISRFPGRFLNVHLGLSPYYRGSGTNFFPLVDGAPEYVGATFMHLDAGIDTGEIIHQIRARVFPGDTPHQIGNRLIGDVAVVYGELIRRFDELEPVSPPPEPETARLCKRKDFTEAATEKLYEQFGGGMIERYLAEVDARYARVPIAVNPGLADIAP